MRKLIFALVLAASGSALAQTREAPPPTPSPEPPPVSLKGGSWGVVGALTAPINTNVVEAGLGWPGIHASFVRGISKELEMGGRFSFNYGVEGALGPTIPGQSSSVVPGLKFQFLVRFKLFDTGKVSVAVRFEPGAMFYFFPSSGVITCASDQFGNVVCGRSGSVIGGLSLPLGIRLGIIASNAINVGVSFDLPMWFAFGRTATFLLPVMTGVGVEYFVQSNLLLYFNVKMGPTLSSGGGTALFTFESKLGVGYRF